MSQELLEVVKDGVAVLTMNRPDRLNALSGPMLDAMRRHFLATSRYEWMFWDMGWRREVWPV